MTRVPDTAVCPWCGLSRVINRARDGGPCRSCTGRKEIKGPRDWKQEAACDGVNIDLFFDEAMMRKRWYLFYCEACPVADECLDFATRNGERYGVWGGLTPDQRSHMHLRKPTTGDRA
jgi:WhiB family redox-sensing transcriptional regulator